MGRAASIRVAPGPSQATTPVAAEPVCSATGECVSRLPAEAQLLGCSLQSSQGYPKWEDK